MLKFNELQQTCIKLLTMPAPYDDSAVTTSLFEQVDNSNVQNLLAAIFQVAMGNGGAVSTLRGSFNLVQGVALEKHFNLEGSLNPFHKELLNSIQKYFTNTISDIECRKLSPLELSIFATLNHLITRPKALFSDQEIQLLTDAVLGNEDRQLELIESKLVPQLIDDSDLQQKTVNLTDTIAHYYSLSMQILTNLSAATQEQENDEPNFEQMIELYKKAYTMALQAKASDFPHIEEILDRIREPLSLFVQDKILAIKNEHEFETIKEYCKKLVTLVKLLEAFQHPKASQLTSLLNELDQTIHERDKNIIYEQANDMINNVKRRSYYPGKTFRNIKELLTENTALDTQEALQLLQKIDYQALKTKIEVLNEELKTVLSGKDLSLDQADLTQPFKALQKRCAQHEDLKTLLEISLKVIEARSCLVNENFDDATRLVDNLSDSHEVVRIMRLLIIDKKEEYHENQLKKKKKPKQKITITTEDVTPKVKPARKAKNKTPEEESSPTRNLTFLEGTKSINTTEIVKKLTGIEATPAVTKEVTPTQQSNTLPTNNIIDAIFSSTTTSSIPPQISPTLAEEIDDVNAKLNLQANAQPNIAINYDRNQILPTMPHHVARIEDKQPPKKSGFRILGISLLVVGCALLAAGSLMIPAIGPTVLAITLTATFLSTGLVSLITGSALIKKSFHSHAAVKENAALKPAVQVTSSQAIDDINHKVYPNPANIKYYGTTQKPDVIPDTYHGTAPKPF